MTLLDPDHVMSRFNAVVRAAAPYLNSAPRHSGSFPQMGTSGYVNDSRLGSRTEISHSGPDLGTGGQLVASVIFNVLHGFAMELTRVRKTHAFHFTNTGPIDGNIATTALNPNFAAYFPIPSYPAPGDVVNLSQLETFLSALSTRVNAIRNDPTNSYVVDIVTCHGNCHSACHSSRNRR